MISTVITVRFTTDLGEAATVTCHHDIPVRGGRVTEKSLLVTALEKAMEMGVQQGANPHAHVNMGRPVVLFWKVLEDEI